MSSHLTQDNLRHRITFLDELLARHREFALTDYTVEEQWQRRADLQKQLDEYNLCECGNHETELDSCIRGEIEQKYCKCKSRVVENKIIR
jgi:hypothetical protein